MIETNPELKNTEGLEKARNSYINLINKKREGLPPIYTGVEGPRSAAGKLADKSVYLNTVSHSNGSLALFTEDGKTGWVFPNPKVAYRPTATRDVFPTLTEGEYNASKENVQPMKVTLLEDGRWMVDRSGESETPETNTESTAVPKWESVINSNEMGYDYAGKTVGKKGTLTEAEALGVAKGDVMPEIKFNEMPVEFLPIVLRNDDREGQIKGLNPKDPRWAWVSPEILAKAKLEGRVDLDFQSEPNKPQPESATNPPEQKVAATSLREETLRLIGGVPKAEIERYRTGGGNSRISSIQRRFNIGYNEASNIRDYLLQETQAKAVDVEEEPIKPYKQRRWEMLDRHFDINNPDYVTPNIETESKKVPTPLLTQASETNQELPKIARDKLEGIDLYIEDEYFDEARRKLDLLKKEFGERPEFTERYALIDKVSDVAETGSTVAQKPKTESMPIPSSEEEDLATLRAEMEKRKMKAEAIEKLRETIEKATKRLAEIDIELADIPEEISPENSSLTNEKIEDIKEKIRQWEFYLNESTTSLEKAKKELKETSGWRPIKRGKIQKEIDSLAQNQKEQQQALQNWQERLKAEIARVEALEEDKVKNPFKWQLIDKLHPTNFKVLFGVTRETITLEGINKIMDETGQDITNKVWTPGSIDVTRDYAGQFYGNGFYLKLKNIDEVRGEKGIEIHGDKAIYDLISPDGQIISSDISYQIGAKLISEKATEYQEEQRDLFNNEIESKEMESMSTAEEKREFLERKRKERINNLKQVSFDIQYNTKNLESDNEWTRKDAERSLQEINASPLNHYEETLKLYPEEEYPYNNPKYQKVVDQINAINTRYNALIADLEK